jgi:hypothetical protein
VAGSTLAEQSYRVYRTHSGFRLICSSLPMDRRDAGMKALSHCWLRFLGADPRYIRLCQERDNYRARLTAKPSRVEGQDGFKSVWDLMEGLCVAFFDDACRPSGEFGADIHPDLAEQIRLHDEMCLPLGDDDSVA